MLVCTLVWSLWPRRYEFSLVVRIYALIGASQVIQGCIRELNVQAAKQALPQELPSELRSLLLASTHRIASARDIASRYLNRLITSFPSLMCDPPLVFAILEVLTLLRRACANEFFDEVGTQIFS